MAEQPDQTPETEKIQLEGMPSCIDVETLRKLKELCQRYGKDRVKQMITEAA